MAPSPVSLRPSTSEDAPQVIALLRDYLRVGRADDAFWHWKFEQGTPAGATLTMVALDGDRVVGFASACPYRVVLPDSATVTAHEIEDVVVHPDYRRRGLGVALCQRIIERAEVAGGQFTYLFSSEMAHGMYAGALGYVPALEIPTRRGFVDIVGALRHRLPAALAAFVGRPANSVVPAARAAARGRAIAGSRGLRIGLATWTPLLRGLWVEKPGVCAIERSVAHLDWRFSGHPWHQYVTAAVGDGDTGVDGYVVVSRGLLIDFACRDVGTGTHLLQWALGRAAANGADEVRATGAYPREEEEALEAVGLRHLRGAGRRSTSPMEVSRTLMVRAGSGSAAPVASLQQAVWRFSVADISSGL